MPKDANNMSKGFAFVEFFSPQVRAVAAASAAVAGAGLAGKHQHQQQCCGGALSTAVAGTTGKIVCGALQ
jgi:hypothetical protein